MLFSLTNNINRTCSGMWAICYPSKNIFLAFITSADPLYLKWRRSYVLGEKQILLLWKKMVFSFFFFFFGRSARPLQRNVSNIYDLAVNWVAMACHGLKFSSHEAYVLQYVFWLMPPGLLIPPATAQGILSPGGIGQGPACFQSCSRLGACALVAFLILLLYY